MTVGSPVLAAFSDEAEAFAAALDGLPEVAWERPTRCLPWRVRELVGHVITALARVPDAVAAPAPDRPDTTAISYYRADERFSGAANADRVRTASDRSAAGDVAALARQFADTWRDVAALCRQQPPDRVVRTRHGDAMLLAEFLTTRVVELVAHGLDVADAVPCQPWLTPAAAQHLLLMLFGPGWPAALAETGGDPVTLIRKATGRAPVDGHESALLDRLGMRRLAFG